MRNGVGQCYVLGIASGLVVLVAVLCHDLIRGPARCLKLQLLSIYNYQDGHCLFLRWPQGFTAYRPCFYCYLSFTSTATPEKFAATRSATNTTSPHQNASLCVKARFDDLIPRMTIEEKAGQLFHTITSVGANGTFDEGSETANGTITIISEMFISHYNLGSNIVKVTQTVEWQNAIQELALSTRHGIPLTLSTDPRHAFTENIGNGFAANRFSQWPESLGLAALRVRKQCRGLPRSLERSMFNGSLET